MKLNELDYKNHASKALKENFDVDFNVNSLNKNKTKTMLSKVNNLIKEAKQSSDFYKNQTSPSYMKLVFMEQALRSHYTDLMSRPTPRIVIENEEVAKSQSILAAQDMIDTVQKMLEDINDMMVKELPALVSSIQTDIGANESQEFNSQANEALESINQTLISSKATLEGALGTITGQVGPAFDQSDDIDVSADVEVDDMADDDFGIDDVEDDLDLDVEEPTGPVGRAKR